MKIYYITRTWTTKEKANSCAYLRVLYADSLRKLGEVTIVTPSYTGEKILSDNMISFPLKKHMRIENILQFLRLKEDYLDSWMIETYNYLKEIVKPEDVVFCTTGGELACIKLGHALKKQCKSKFVIHFRDPVDGDIINGEKVAGYWGFNRKALIDKYCENVDGIFTYSKDYADELSTSKRGANCKVYYSHTGYYKKVTLPEYKEKTKRDINIVYAGTVSKVQNCELMYHALKDMDNIKLTYIVAKPEELKKKMPEENVVCLPLMQHDRFLDYMINEADVGFASIIGLYTMTGIPSKIYEYINLALPILGAVQKDGTAYKIINDNKYGVACSDSVSEIQNAARKLLDNSYYNEAKKNLYLERDNWYYGETEKKFLKDMIEIIGVKECVE